MLRKFIFASIFLLIGAPVYADCLNQNNNADIKQCLQGEYEKADKDLNAVYSQLMAKLDADGKEKLKKAQRAWILFRDADADFDADRYRGGTFAGVASLSALRDLTTQRVKDLTIQLKQGDQ